MKATRIENNDFRVKIENLQNDYLKLEIRTSPINMFALGILLVIGLFCFIIPISILLIPALEIGIGFVITLILFWGSSIFFIRNFLWNKYGKEVYEIGKSNLDYYYDYRLFKDNVKKVNLDNLKIGYCKIEAPNDVTLYSKDDKIFDYDCYLVFVNNDEFIKSNISINYKHLSEIAERLECLF